jgi:hypothetical protein
MRIRHVVVLAAASLSILALVACSKPKEGAACKKAGEVKCLDDKNGLVCDGSVYLKVACEGATGCMTVVGEGSCSYAKTVGGYCEKEGEPQCTEDHKNMIKCTGNHWKLLEECKGALGCVANVHGAKCDLGASTEGSACTKENEGNASCTPDNKGLLLCKSGKMTLVAKCKGMHACRQLGNKIDCDETIGDLNDICEEADKQACSSDKKMRLVCKNNKWAKDKDCKRCNVMPGSIDCS